MFTLQTKQTKHTSNFEDNTSREKTIVSIISIDLLMMILEHACMSHYDIYNISLTCKLFYSILRSKQFYPNNKIISICNNSNIVDNFPNFTFMTDFSYCDCLFKRIDIKHDFIKVMCDYNLFPISNSFQFQFKLKQVLDKLNFIKNKYKHLQNELKNELQHNYNNNPCNLPYCTSNTLTIHNDLIDMKDVDLYNKFIITFNNLYNCFVLGLKKNVKHLRLTLDGFITYFNNTCYHDLYRNYNNTSIAYVDDELKELFKAHILVLPRELYSCNYNLSILHLSIYYISDYGFLKNNIDHFILECTVIDKKNIKTFMNNKLKKFSLICVHLEGVSFTDSLISNNTQLSTNKLCFNQLQTLTVIKSSSIKISKEVFPVLKSFTFIRLTYFINQLSIDLEEIPNTLEFIYFSNPGFNFIPHPIIFKKIKNISFSYVDSYYNYNVNNAGVYELYHDPKSIKTKHLEVTMDDNDEDVNYTQLPEFYAYIKNLVLKNFYVSSLTNFYMSVKYNFPYIYDYLINKYDDLSFKNSITIQSSSSDIRLFNININILIRELELDKLYKTINFKIVKRIINEDNNIDLIDFLIKIEDYDSLYLTTQHIQTHTNTYNTINNK